MNSKNIIPTGFRSLNEALGAEFYNGSLTVIAARPGMGKTTFAVQCAANMSKTAKKQVNFFGIVFGTNKEQIRFFGKIKTAERLCKAIRR